MGGKFKKMSLNMRCKPLLNFNYIVEHQYNNLIEDKEIFVGDKPYNYQDISLEMKKVVLESKDVDLFIRIKEKEAKLKTITER